MWYWDSRSRTNQRNEKTACGEKGNVVLSDTRAVRRTGGNEKRKGNSASLFGLRRRCEYFYYIKKDIATMKSTLQNLSEQETKYAAELMDVWFAVCEKKERSAGDRVKATYGEKYDPMMHDGKGDVANLLREEA